MVYARAAILVGIGVVLWLLNDLIVRGTAGSGRLAGSDAGS